MKHKRMGNAASGLLALIMMLALALPAAAPAYAASDIVISQVYGGGGNSGAVYTNDFIELFNRGTAAVSLTGWSVQYASATGSGNFGANSGQITPLPDITVQPGQYVLIQEAQGSGGTTSLPSPDVVDSTPINMSSSGGKVALVNTGTSLGCNGYSTTCPPDALAAIVDLVGWDGANFFEGSGPAPATSNTTADLRLEDGCQDTDNNSADFEAGPPMPRNTGSPLHSCGGPVNAPVLVDCGAAITTDYGTPASTTVGATDADGTVVDMAITDISPALTSGTIVLSDFVAASAPGGMATAIVTVDAAVSPRVYAVTLTATNNDTPEAQTGTCTLSVTVKGIVTIGAVQGIVGDDVDGATFPSPYEDETVVIQGVVYETIVSRSSSGYSSYAFFIQNTPATADGNPDSSDGVYVYAGSYPDLKKESGGYYYWDIGDEVVLRGSVSEYYDLTEMYKPLMLTLVREGVDLEAELPPVVVDPPADLAQANRYWERIEGMRAEVPAGSLAVSGRDVFASTMDGEAWFIRADSPVAQRADPYARRVFRDPHPLDDISEQLFDNANGYRILMGSLGIKATANDNTALIAPTRTFDTLTNAPVGGVYYSYSKYSVQVGQQIEYVDGVDPSLNAPPAEPDLSSEYSIVTFNMENLYDYRNDPFSGCDFADDSGCPGVYPPFDYVPASEADYFERVDEIAGQIVGALHSPDVIMAQEIENQDICSMTGDDVTCGDVNNADGQPDALEDLAAAIIDMDGPTYVSAFDRDGADDRGITCAFLYRADRAELLPADADNPVLGDSPQVDYPSEALPYNSDVENPKALNAVLPDWVDTSTGVDGDNVFTRAPEVGYFRIWRDGVGASVFADAYLIDNHFSSTPDARVGQRTEQAAYNAAIVDALEAAFPGVYVSLGGDLNVYPRPDDPFEPDDPLYPSDQLGALYNQGLTNLYDFLVSELPVTAYSYVYQGQAQTLDQMFANPDILGDFVRFRASHINSDWPKDYFGDGPRGTSDHDPQLARYTLLPTLDRLEALLNYYVGTEDITGNKTAEVLLNHLTNARQFMENGKQQAYESQLQAFINQVQGKAPQFVAQYAADALSQEAALLLAMD